MLILNGICDVLVKNKKSQRYFIMKETVEELVLHYKSQLKRGRELLEIFFDDSIWVFNPFTGADIADYNNPQRQHLQGEVLAEYHRNKTPDEFQSVLDQAYGGPCVNSTLPVCKQRCTLSSLRSPLPPTGLPV